VTAVLAIDIGGTKLAAGLVDPDGTVRGYRKVPTGQDPSGSLNALLDGLPGEDVLGLGVSCGGPMTWPDGFISPPNTSVWRDGFPLGDVLRRRFEGLPVRIHNDVVCLAVGEHWKGAGQGVDNLLGMVVSTGVGGGILQRGRVIDGRSGNAGHVGHVVVDPAGPVCGCGGRGCVEAIARGPATVAWAVSRGSRARDGLELSALAEAGDPIAVEALARSGNALGVGIASAAALLDIDLVLLGGGLSQAGEALWGPMRSAIAAHAGLGFLSGLRVEPTALGQLSGLVGAGALLHEGDRYWSAG
jgi:glucokinase